MTARGARTDPRTGVRQPAASRSSLPAWKLLGYLPDRWDIEAAPRWSYGRQVDYGIICLFPNSCTRSCLMHEKVRGGSVLWLNVSVAMWPHFLSLTAKTTDVHETVVRLSCHM